MKLRLRYRLILLNLTLLLFLKYATPAQWKIDLRQALFTDTTATTDAFCSPVLQTTDFLWANDSTSNLFLTKYQVDTSYHLIIPRDTFSNIQYIKQLVLKFSKNGGEGCGARSNDLARNILWVSEGTGHGCCSDHSQVFLALSQINGVKAREVHHSSHTFNEYFDTELQKWIWVDTQFALMAKDSKGNYLSFCELSKNMKADILINWDFFGSVYHSLYHLNPNAHEYFRKAEFEKMLLTKGNNVFQVDYYNRNFRYIPTELRQFLLLSMGIQPRYLQLDSDGKITQRYKLIKTVFVLILLVYGGLNLFQWFHVNKNSK